MFNVTKRVGYEPYPIYGSAWWIPSMLLWDTPVFSCTLDARPTSFHPLYLLPCPLNYNLLGFQQRLSYRPYITTLQVLSNLHNTEALRLLEGVQPILQPGEMLVSYTATLLRFCFVAFIYPWDIVWHLPNLSATPSLTHLPCWPHHHLGMNVNNPILHDKTLPTYNLQGI